MLQFRELRRATIALGMLLSLPAAAATVTPIAPVFASNDGFTPYTGLTELAGKLYGTAGYGGAYGHGVVYAVDRSTGAETVVYSFKGGADGSEPAAPVTAVGGVLYGTTGYGGSANYGTVFRLDPTTGIETVVYSFQNLGNNEDRYPGTKLASVGGLLYGLTDVLFSVDPSTGTETVLHVFYGNKNDASGLLGPLLNVGGKLYGVSSTGGKNGIGTVYQFNIATGVESVLYSFGAESYYNVNGALASVGGQLYGVAQYSYANGGYTCGVVFSVDQKSGAENLVHTFQCTDGKYPWGGLTEAGGQLYGTTLYGGASDNGVVFTVDPASGATRDIASFDNGTNGSVPYGPPVYDSGIVYGTASAGGARNAGTVFAADVTSDSLTALHTCTGTATNTGPEGLLALNGSLFLTTSIGGAFSSGAVTKIDPASGNQTILYSFTGGADGGSPHDTVLNYGGKLYGTAQAGGAAGFGVVYSVDPKSGKEAVVHAFAGGSDGADPQGALVVLNGLLYGTTYGGGAAGNGTVYSLDPASGNETVLYSFAGAPNDGAHPEAGLLNVGGVLWGTTFAGGTGSGTVFKIDPASGTETVAYIFASGHDGEWPEAALVNLGGTLYGTTVYGPGGRRSSGSVFSINPVTGAKATVFKFPKGGIDGRYPETALLASGKDLYGVTSKGGQSGRDYGAVFKLRIKPSGAGTENVLSYFTDFSVGVYPYSALVKLNGIFYGATTGGSQAELGMVYSLTP